MVFQDKFPEMENRISLLTKEIERLNLILMARIEEIEQWKQKNQKLEATLAELRIFQSKCGELESRITYLLKEGEEWKRKNSNLENTCAELRVF